MGTQIGANPAVTHTSADKIAGGIGFSPGDTYTDHNGYDWIYVQTTATPIPQFTLTRVLASATAFPWTSAGANGTAAAGGAGLIHGFAASASIPASSYGWVMTKGVSGVRVSATGNYIGRVWASPSANAGFVTKASASGTLLQNCLFLDTTASTTALGTAGGAVKVAFWNLFTVLV